MDSRTAGQRTRQHELRPPLVRGFAWGWRLPHASHAQMVEDLWTTRTRMRCLFQVFAFQFSRRCLRLYLAILGASTESCLGCASDVRVMKHVGRRCAPGYFTLLSSGTIAMVFLLGC